MGFPFFSRGKRKTKLRKGDKIHFAIEDRTGGCSFYFTRRGKRIDVVKKNDNGDKCPHFLDFVLTRRAAKDMVMLLAASHGFTILKEELIFGKEHIFTLG